MSLMLLDGPAEEPLSLAAAKAFLKIEHDADDALVGALIAAARMQVEAVTGRLLVSQSWRLVLDAWPPGGTVLMPISPLISVDVVRVIAEDDGVVEVAPERVKLDAAGRPPRLYVSHRPTPRARAGIEIDVSAGYGAAADVPEVFVQAIRLLVGHWHERRTPVPASGSAGALPFSVAALLAPQRSLRL